MTRTTRRTKDALYLVREVVKVHEPLRRLIGQSQLRVLGHGQQSIVFTLGKDRVLRVTRDASTADCDVPQQLLERPSIGWPEVHDVILVRAEDGDACLVVSEKVTPWSRLSRSLQNELEDVAAIVEGSHRMGRLAVGELKRLPKRSQEWAKQLWSGLKAVGRLKDEAAIDTIGDNFGLNRRDEAVWVDFGV